MKPIRLSLAGLHSFRQRQEIDFEQLCAGGIFGIFGPTGSGKSTILDAITLALYGKVERASNHTQGIMNQAEDELIVSFTFDLKHAQGTRRYTVERSYKRSNEISIRNSIARIIKEDLESGEKTVLADKSSDVDKAVEQLLGLSSTDFLRAVVLPQGKFAEFLALKGVERRQMLQRLFQLEQYGEKLNQRVKQRVQSMQQEEEKLSAEIQGLGDASEPAVKAAEKAYTEAKLSYSKQEQEWQAFEKQFEEQKQLYQWTVEKAQYLSEEQSLLQQLPDIEQQENKLKRAEAAERISPYLEAWQQSREQTKELEVKRIQQEQALKQCQLEYDKQEQEWQQASKDITEQTPLYFKYQALADQGAELEQELQLLTTKYAQQLKDSERMQEQLKQQQTLKHEQEQALQMTTQQIEQLQQVIEVAKQVLPKRRRFEAAARAAQNIHYLSQHLMEKEAAYTLFKEKQASLKQGIQKKQEQHEQLHHKLAKFFQQGQAYNQALSSLAQLLETAREALKALVDHVNQEAAKAYREQLANELKQGLQDGEPCPVCGSIHQLNTESTFPQQAVPAVHNTWELLQQELTDLSEQLQQQELLLNQLKAKQLEWEKQLQKTRGEQGKQWLSRRDKTASPEIEEKDEIASTIQLNLTLEDELRQFTEAIHTLRTKTLHSEELIAHGFEPENLTNELAQFEGIFSRLQEPKVQQETFLQNWADCHNEIIQLEQRIAFEEEQLQGFVFEEQQHIEQVEKLKQQQMQETKAWQQEYSPWQWDALEQLEAEIVQEEASYAKHIAEQEALQQQLKQLQEQAQQVQSACVRLEEQAQQAKQKLEELKEAQTDKSTKLKELKESLTIKAEQSLIQYKEKLEERWQSKQQQEKKLRQATDQLARQLQALREQYAATQQAEQDAFVRSEHSEKQALAQLTQEGFSTIQEWEEARLPAEECHTLKQSCEAYRLQLLKLQQNLERLASFMQEKELTQAHWQELQVKRTALYETLQQALEQRGILQKALEQLQERHLRYTEIINQRQKLSDELDLHKQLQLVLKGNGFVEFLAQEQLQQVCHSASEQLGQLTRHRFALELDSSGAFVIRDDANGGYKRPVSTLSGGETFVTSLALALALSTQIQLKGEYPLEFFFLDEGFGTLDPELLDTVLTALEKLQQQELAVGLISHVPELKERIPRKCIVSRAGDLSVGSKVKIEVS